jgi:hypothetical protein
MAIHDVGYNLPIGTNVPSTMEPFKLKYQLIALSAPEVQLRAGVKPYNTKIQDYLGI